MICFDLEFYVPRRDRESSRTSLRVNPCKEGHHLLGGVFVNISRNPQKKIPHEKFFNSFWVWREDPSYNPLTNYKKAERSVLAKIYDFFESSWNYSLKQKKNNLYNRKKTRVKQITLGTGIARVDLPFLFIRSQKYHIAPDDQLFRAYLAGFPIDLTNVGLGLIDKVKSVKDIGPIPTSELMQICGINKSKESGKVVWDFVDNKKYANIEKRTIEEVKVNVRLYQCFFRKKMNQKYDET